MARRISGCPPDASKAPGLNEDGISVPSAKAAKSPSLPAIPSGLLAARRTSPTRPPPNLKLADNRCAGTPSVAECGCGARANENAQDWPPRPYPKPPHCPTQKPVISRPPPGWSERTTRNHTPSLRSLTGQPLFSELGSLLKSWNRIACKLYPAQGRPTPLHLREHPPWTFRCKVILTVAPVAPIPKPSAAIGPI